MLGLERARAKRRRTTLALDLGLAVAGGGCGDDDASYLAGDVSVDDAASAECSPVGTDLEDKADDVVEISLDDYAFNPASVTVEAGTVTFATENVGEEDRELAFLPGGGEVPLTDDGAPDEGALADADAFELEAYGPSGTCNATYELEPGTYTLFCIVEAEDGETHLDKGMVGELVVE